MGAERRPQAYSTHHLYLAIVELRPPNIGSDRVPHTWIQDASNADGLDTNSYSTTSISTVQGRDRCLDQSPVIWHHQNSIKYSDLSCSLLHPTAQFPLLLTNPFRLLFLSTYQDAFFQLCSFGQHGIQPLSGAVFWCHWHCRLYHRTFAGST